MKRHIKTISYLLLVMAVALMAPMAMTQEEEQAAVATPEKIAGKIVSVNPADSTLVVGSEVIIISDSTTITKGAEIVGLADLAADDEVTVECTTDEGGKKQAVNVTVL